jgi:hypothetical protein
MPISISPKLPKGSEPALGEPRSTCSSGTSASSIEIEVVETPEFGGKSRLIGSI